MKKIISVICLVLFCASIAFGQSTTMTIGTVTTGNVNDTISVPVTVSNFVNVGAISAKIAYDQNVLNYVSVSDSKFTTNAVNGVLAISWYDATSSNPINMSSGTLLTIKFVYKGGTSSLNFITSQCEIANKLGDVIPTVFNDGRVGKLPTVSFGTATFSGTTVSIPLNVAAFKNVGAVSIKIKFDTSVLTYNNSTNVPTGSFTDNAANGVLTIGWYDANTPLNLDGKFVTLNFTYKGGQSFLNFDVANCEIANNLGNILTGVQFVNTTVGRIPKLSMGNPAYTGSAVSIPLNVIAFKGIGAVSLKIKYDPAVLTFNDCTNGPASNFTYNAANGVLTIGWYDANGFGSDTAKFASLNFTYNGGQTALSFDQANCEISNGLGQPITVSYTDALIGNAPTLSFGTATVSGTTFSIPVSIKDFSNVSAVSLKIKYDTSVLTFKDVANQPTGNFTFNAKNGVLTLGWYDTNPMTVASGNFVTLNFTYNGGSSVLSFDQPNCEIANANGQAIGAKYTDGVVGNAPTLTLGTAVITGTTASLPLNVQYFKNVGAVSLKIKYNTTALTFKDCTNGPASNFTSNAANGVLTIGWYDANGFSSDSAKFATINFTYNGGRGDLTFDKPNCEISTVTGNPITASFKDGFVGVAPSLTIPRVAGVQGKSVAIPINVKNFTNIGAVSLKIAYNSNMIEYVNCTGAPQNNFTATAANGVLTLGWYDANGLTIADGKFVTVNFNYNGGQSNLAFNSTQSEVSDVNGNPMYVDYTNGSVEQDLAPVFTSAMKDTTAKEGTKFTFNYKASDPNTLETLKFSLVDKPVGATIDSLTGAFTWTPDYNAAQTNSGKYKVTVAVVKANFTTSSTCTLTVQNTNRPPVFTAAYSSVFNSKDTLKIRVTGLNFTYKATDPDNDKVTFVVVQAPMGAKIVDTTGVFTWTPQSYLDKGRKVIVIGATDGSATTKDTIIAYVNFDWANGVEKEPGTPTEYSLKQNYPNPFNPTTNIKYSIPQESRVSLRVYNLIGQEVATVVNQVQPVGNYEVSFNAANLPSGIYIYRLEAGTYSQVKKMTLLK